MKTKILFAIVFSFFCIQLFPQFKIGIRGGISSSSIKADDLVDNNIGVKLESLSDAMVGFHFGLVTQAKFMGAYLQPELLFSSTGGKVKLSDINGSRIVDQKFSRIDIPVIVGKTFGPARIGLGPVASFIINSKSELTDIQGYDDKFKTATIGYQVDLGIDISHLAIDLKYEGNLSKLGDGVNIGTAHYNFDSRGHQFILSIGYFF
jgi:hypothetical protein